MSVQPRKTADIAKVIARRREAVLAREETWALVRRVLILGAAAVLVLTQLFLLTQVEGNDMYPALRDGDLALVYRLQGEYSRGDVIAYRSGGERHFGRIVATAGDEVIISESGALLVNSQLESGEILFPTTMEDGGEYRCKVLPGQVFVLGDYRTQARDSREFGPIQLNDVEGKLITLMRRRGL